MPTALAYGRRSPSMTAIEIERLLVCIHQTVQNYKSILYLKNHRKNPKSLPVIHRKNPLKKAPVFATLGSLAVGASGR